MTLHIIASCSTISHVIFQQFPPFYVAPYWSLSLHVVTCCNMFCYTTSWCSILLYIATYCYMWLRVVICCYMSLYVVTCSYVNSYMGAWWANPSHGLQFPHDTAYQSVHFAHPYLPAIHGGRKFRFLTQYS